MPSILWRPTWPLERVTIGVPDAKDLIILSSVRDAVDPGRSLQINRELLATLDEAKTSGEHWKILLTSGMGFFTDAYDLFIIGVVMSLIAQEWHITSWQKSLVSEFGPNTTTFVYPAEIFPVRVRTTSHGIAAAAGKIGAFVGTYALTSLLPVIGLGRTSAIVALLGALATLALLPEPKGQSLETLTEAPLPRSAIALGIAESRGTRPPSA